MSVDTLLRNYFTLRGALLKYQQLPWQLSETEQAGLASAVKREERLVQRALSSPVAEQVRVDEATVQEAVESFISRMAHHGEASLLMKQAGLQPEALKRAIDAEMRAAAVLEQLTAAAAPSELEVYHWYEANPDRFVVRERREVFQILITVNELYRENHRETARQRIHELARKANAAPDSFGALAQQHSECPSAVEAGRLGVAPPGHLYPELDRELFELESGAISNVVESPLGFHLLRCGVIEPSRRLGWDEVRDSLTRKLTEQNRKLFLQQWLSGTAT